MAITDKATAPVSQAALHIELADAHIKSVKHQSGKAVWVIEVEPQNQNTTLADIDAILGENYKAQVTIEAEYEEPVAAEDGKVPPGQQKLPDWTTGSDAAPGSGA